MNWMEAALLILGIGAFVASFIIPEKKNNDEKMQEIDVEVIRKLIEKEMEKLFSDLKQEMKHVQKQKKSQASYTNPYKSVQVSDGTYLDSKN